VANTNRQSARLSRRVDECVGEQIRRRRTMMGLTQEQLATALDISYQQVQKYETGTNRVSAGRLYEISKLLDSDMSYFFDTIEPKETAPQAPQTGRDRASIELVRSFNAIEDPTVRSAVASLVKNLSMRGSGEPTTLQEMGNLLRAKI